MEASDVGVEKAERDLACCTKLGRVTDASRRVGVGGNKGDTVSSNEKEDWKGLAVALEDPEAVFSGVLLVRPPQLSLML